jgi:uncharacterized membrane protein
MIVPSPIAFFVSTLVADLVYRGAGRPGFADAAMWLLGAGLAGGLLAAVLGLTDFLKEPRVRALRQAWLHMGGNVLRSGQRQVRTFDQLQKAAVHASRRPTAVRAKFSFDEQRHWSLTNGQACSTKAT